MRLLFLSFRIFFFFKQKTAYEMRISDWSSDVCSSDLRLHRLPRSGAERQPDAELARALGDRRRDESVDPDRGQERRDGAQREEQRRHEPLPDRKSVG